MAAVCAVRRTTGRRLFADQGFDRAVPAAVQHDLRTYHEFGAERLLRRQLLLRHHHSAAYRVSTEYRLPSTEYVSHAPNFDSKVKIESSRTYLLAISFAGPRIRLGRETIFRRAVSSKTGKNKYGQRFKKVRIFFT